MQWWDFVLQVPAVLVVMLPMVCLTGGRALGSGMPFDTLVIVPLSTAVWNLQIGEDTLLIGGLMWAAVPLARLADRFCTTPSKRLDLLIQGRPVVLAQEGQIDAKGLFKRNVSDADFESAKRRAACRHDEEFDAAVLETSERIIVPTKCRS